MKRNYRIEYQLVGISHDIGSFVLLAKSEEDAKEYGEKVLEKCQLRAVITSVTKL